MIDINVNPDYFIRVLQARLAQMTMSDAKSEAVILSLTDEVEALRGELAKITEIQEVESGIVSNET